MGVEFGSGEVGPAHDHERGAAEVLVVLVVQPALPVRAVEVRVHVERLLHSARPVHLLTSLTGRGVIKK